MNDLYDIIELLERLVVEHERMLKLARHKKDVLITGKIDELARIIQFESRCISTIQSLELEREKQISLYLMKRGIRQETCYLSDLIEMTHEPEKKRALQRCQQELGELVRELQDLNKLNQKLIEQSLAFVTTTLDELTEPPEEAMYQKRTANQQNPYARSQQRFFDSKA